MIGDNQGMPIEPRIRHGMLLAMQSLPHVVIEYTTTRKARKESLLYIFFLQNILARRLCVFLR